MMKQSKKILALFVFACLLCQTIFPASHAGTSPLRELVRLNDESSSETTEAEPSYVEGQVIVSMNDNYDTTKELKDYLAKADKKVSVVPLSNEGNGTTALVTAKGSDTKQLLKELNQLKEVSSCEPDYLFQKADTAKEPYADLQWYLSEETDSSPASTHYKAAESLTKSSTPIVVVADTGIDGTQEDLTDVLYNNNSTGMYNAINNTYGSYQDSDGHGTHIAGIIGASLHNNKGIRGLADVKILGLRCIDAEGSSSLSYLIRAYNYIISQKKNGVNICAINLSLGGEMNLTNNPNGSVLNNLITTAGQLGILSICAAGNEGMNIDTHTVYPACFDNPYIISVGASNESGKVASFSNYGKNNVDLYAPGTNIFSTYVTENYNAECDHSLSYEDYNSAVSLSDYVTDSTATLTRQANGGISQNSAQSSGSLKWDISATAGETYYLTVPFSLTSACSKNGYFSLRFRGEADSLLAQSATHEVGLAITRYNTLKTSLSSKNGIINSVPDYTAAEGSEDAAPYEIDFDKDVWYQLPMQIAAKGHALTAGQYYAILSFTPTKNGSYSLYLDNVGAGTTLQSYAYDSGTSMATPMVTGEAAMLAAIYPAAAAMEIKSRILGGVTTAAAWTDTCSSGGYINFYKAATNPSPSLSEAIVNDDGNSCQINGYFFGTTTGSVTFTNTNTSVSTTMPVTSWSDQQVVVSTKDLATGTYQVRLTRADQENSKNTLTTTYTAPVKVTSLSLNRSKVTLSPNKKFTLKAVCAPLQAKNLSVRFETSNASYASVSSSGVITAKKAGNKHKAVITCTAKDNESVHATCTVTIKQKVTKIKLNKTKLSLKAGRSVKLSATVYPNYAVNKKVKWKTSNKKYATVTQKGKVTTKKKGKGKKVTITCQAKDGSKKKKTCRITIR